MRLQIVPSLLSRLSVSQIDRRREKVWMVLKRDTRLFCQEARVMGSVVEAAWESKLAIANPTARQRLDRSSPFYKLAAALWDCAAENIN
jgi:hypothetical protein